MDDNEIEVVASLAAWRSMVKPFGDEINCEFAPDGLTLFEINNEKTNSNIAHYPCAMATIRPERVNASFGKKDFLQWAALVAKETPRGNPSSSALIAFRITTASKMTIADPDGMSVRLNGYTPQDDLGAIKSFHRKAETSRHDAQVCSLEIPSGKLNPLMKSRAWMERESPICHLSLMASPYGGETLSVWANLQEEVTKSNLSSRWSTWKDSIESIAGTFDSKSGLRIQQVPTGVYALHTTIDPRYLQASAKCANIARPKDALTRITFGHGTPVLIRWTNKFGIEFQSLIAPHTGDIPKPNDPRVELNISAPQN